VLGLTDNMAIFSAYANDEGYENVFAQQLASLIRRGDIVIGISASGNSPNVLRAMEEAEKHDAFRIGFTGFTGGKLSQMVDLNIHVPNHEYGIVEDIHLMLEHMTVEALKEKVEHEIPPAQILEAIQELPSYAGDVISELFGQPTLTFDEEKLEELPQSTQDLLYSISKEFVERLDLNSLLEKILYLTVQKLGAMSGSMVVLDEEGNVIQGAAVYGGKSQNLTTQQLADIMQQGLAGWVIENRQSVLIPSTRDDPRWLSRDWESEKSRSALSVPLMSQDRVVGVLTTVHPDADRFTREDLSLLTSVALTLSVNDGVKSKMITNGEGNGSS
jgi:D-sedoheptulose 7-phosphate isomerase